MNYQIAHHRIEGSSVKMVGWLCGVNSVFEFKSFCKGYEHNMELEDVYVLYSKKDGKVVDTFMKGEK